MNYHLLTPVLAAASEEMPPGSIIAFDSSLLKTLLPQLVNVVLLTIILTVILYKPVREFLDNRTKTIEDRLDNARASQDEADELKEQYENLLQDVEREREEILSSAYRKAMERSDHILQEARQEAENIYNHQMKELAEEREGVQDDMKRQLIELSTMMASQFVQVSIDKETQDQMVDDLLDDWEEGLWLN